MFAKVTINVVDQLFSHLCFVHVISVLINGGKKLFRNCAKTLMTEVFTTKERLEHIIRMLKNKQCFYIHHVIDRQTVVSYWHDDNVCRVTEYRSDGTSVGFNESVECAAKRVVRLLRDNHDITVEEIVARGEGDIVVAWLQSEELDRIRTEQHEKRKTELCDEIAKNISTYKQRRIDSGFWDDSEDLK